MQRRRYLVAYAIPNGTGRVFLVVDDNPLSRKLILEMEAWLHGEGNTPGGIINNVVPLEIVYNKEDE